MGKTQKKTESKKEESPVSPPEKSIEKKKKHHDKTKSRYKTYTKRLCVEKRIHPLNRDAQRIIDDILDRFIEGTIEHAQNLLRNSKKKFSQKTAILSYIGFTGSNDISNEMTRLGLERGKLALTMINNHENNLKKQREEK
jgi:hypothetical protein